MVGKVLGVCFIGGVSFGFDVGIIILCGVGFIFFLFQLDNLVNEFIYVVDGVIINKNFINMDDVESINVLKGFVVIVFYGLCGGVGVIIIIIKVG